MKNEEVCQVCGLPLKICICSDLERETKKKIEIEDDFQYCEICGYIHYKGNHK